MKTIREWFELLPQEVKEKAIRNTHYWFLDVERNDLQHAISSAFNWSLSPEGLEYWSEIHDNLN